MNKNKLLNYFYLFISLSGILLVITNYFELTLPLSFENLGILFFGSYFLVSLVADKKSYPFLGILIFYLCFKLLLDSIVFNDISTDLRSFLVFITLLFIIKSLRDSPDDINLVKLFEVVNITFLTFFFIQLFFKDILPSEFVNVPNLNSAIGLEKYTREFEGHFVLYRPNALMGNPISLGFFFNIAIAFKFSRTRTSIDNIIIILNIICVLILLSRANYIFLFIILLTNLKKFKLNIKNTLGFIIGCIVMIGYFYDYLVIQLDRFLGNDTYALASNEEHLNDYNLALKILSENLLFGVSDSYIINNNIITDGSIFIMILRLGSVGVILFLGFLISSNSRSFNFIKTNFIFFMGFLFCTVVNSAFNNIINSIWLTYIFFNLNKPNL